MPTLASACPLDCPDACSLEVTVEDGKVVSIGGSYANPLTSGFICSKVSRFGERVHGKSRVFHPLVRTGKKGEGNFRHATWDEALGLVAGKLTQVRQEFGGGAILPYSYGGSNGYLTQDTTDARLWRRLGASRLLRTICAAPTGAAAKALYGKMPGVSLEDYVYAKLIILWGANPPVSGIHLVPKIYAAQQNGGKLIVVDPRRTQLAKRADLHLPVRPGSDLPVAMAIHRWLFESGRADSRFLSEHAEGTEQLRAKAGGWDFASAAKEAGVAPSDIEALARLYAESSPAVIRVGWGLERNRNGGSAAAAIMALPAVAGKFGVRGGGYTMSNSAAWKLDSLKTTGTPEPAARPVNMNLLGRALTEFDSPPVKLLFVYNSNAAATAPRQGKVLAGLAREDLFTVVFDSVMTDTAAFADVVLPATTFLEQEELSRGYGAFVLQNGKPVIPPVGEARPNFEVFAELVRRTGLSAEGEAETAGELRAAILAQSPHQEEFARQLRETGVAVPAWGPNPIQFTDVLPETSDGKVHLFPGELDRECPTGLYGYRPDPATPEFPLAMISPASDHAISSTLFELYERQVPVEIHPEDAAPRQVRDGVRVRVFNSFGEVRCLAKISEDVRPGVVRLPKGLWRKHTLNGSTATTLVPDTLTDFGGGACFNDARVEVALLLP